ncbi:MAG: DUF4143 domain-containing protein [Coriobacteriia bacterium]|nr:DUF4143 domain-containing protein [Coriobacteriia bacterium]
MKKQDYIKRLVDSLLEEYIEGLPAIAIEGPKAVGKTETASRYANTIFSLDNERVRESLAADPELVNISEPPVLIDEWQYYPDIWNHIRRSVDAGASPGSFLLTGSSYPAGAKIHSGAGRIINVRMRPLSLQERGLAPPLISIKQCLSGTLPKHPVSTLEATEVDYIKEIMSSGFPGIRASSDSVRAQVIKSYLNNIATVDFPDAGYNLRRPDSLYRWMTAYAAATGTTASYSKILDAATAGESKKPSKATSIAYRDMLRNLWILDDVEPWIPLGGEFKRLKQKPKHFLADPALAATLLGYDADSLRFGTDESSYDRKYGNVLGRLFESLVALSLKTYAQLNGARLGHFRTQNGDREVDFIIEKGRGIVAIEVKHSPSIGKNDIKHLAWLREKYGPRCKELIVVTAGPYAYRRKEDGILVVPAAMLGA